MFLLMSQFITDHATVIADTIQMLAFIATVAASITAFCIAAMDRRNAQDIAAKDRQLNQLQFKLTRLERIQTALTRGEQPTYSDITTVGKQYLPVLASKSSHRLDIYFRTCITGVDGNIDLSEEIINADVSTALDKINTDIQRLTTA